MWVKLHLTFVRVVSRQWRSDVLYLYRIPVPKWAAFFLARSRGRVVFDFDDALDVAEVEAGTLGRLRRWVLQSGLRNAIRVARVTIASNRRNAVAVESLGGKSIVIPTCVDLTRYVFRERNAPGGAPVVGWIGTPSTSVYLEAIEEALARVRARVHFCLRLVGAAENPFRSLDAEIRPWRLETEAQEIAAFDVGIMPMPDSPWTSGKAALKALQYGASGAPTVAARTETNVDILGADEGTLFASTIDEWTEAIARLVEDARLRGELGRRGRARVERFYSLETQLPRLLDVIRDEPPGTTT
jgi:glycosyltransferase involved in cell wall biosynthesis